jgi:hypothetical protein
LNNGALLDSRNQNWCDRVIKDERKPNLFSLIATLVRSIIFDNVFGTDIVVQCLNFTRTRRAINVCQVKGFYNVQFAIMMIPRICSGKTTRI